MFAVVACCVLFNGKAFKSANKNHCHGVRLMDKQFSGNAGGNHLPSFMANTKEYVTHKDRERIWKRMISLEKKKLI